MSGKALFLLAVLILGGVQGVGAAPWVEGDGATPPAELNLPSFAPVIEKLGRAVVSISIEGREKMANPLAKGSPFGDREGGNNPSPFDFFFQFPPELQGRKSFQSLGSGFVIHPEGLVVTNFHVVDKATKIQVTFRDSRHPYTAKILGTDKKTDLALLKIEGSRDLPAVVLGDSDLVRPGDWVIAIGNPFKLGHTATVGIVSAKSRKVGAGPYEDFIQTDASINPGNSGGPLFNARGEVIGVNTAIFSPGMTGFNIGIGFAIPVNQMKDIVAQLHATGKVTRGWLGVLIQEVSDDLAQLFGLKSPHGALVAEVMQDSPAAKAGIQRGDVIIEYDGKKVEENDDLPLMVAKTPIGKSVEVGIMRKGSRKDLKITVLELQEKEGEDAEVGETEENRLGLSVQDVTPELAKSLGLDSSEGVVVTNVLPDSVADAAGLRRRDVILEVDSKVVTSADEFRRLTRDLKKNKPVLLLVQRNDNTLFFTLKLE